MNESEHIAPVPPGCDLRGLPWMPIDTTRLLDSDLFALATGEEFKAAVALWCKAWQQVPASSLPDDDRILAKLSGAGARWKKVKEQALRGFVKCTDGRLYHPVIAEKALEAWGHRQKQRDRAAKRWHPSGNATAHATAMLGTGKGQGHEQKNPAPQVAPSAPRSTPAEEGEVIERIPLNDGTEFEVRKAFVDELDRLFPAVDPMQTLREIRAWNLAKPARRKTRNGVKSHITTWFGKEQDKHSARAA